MSKKLSRILVISGIFLLLVACGMFAYNQIFDYMAGQRAQELLDQVMAGVTWDLPPIADMVYTQAPPAAETADQDSAPSPAPGLLARGAERSLLDIEIVDYGDAYDDSESSAESNSGVNPGSSSGSYSGSSGGSSSGSSGGWSGPSYSVLGILSIPKLNVRLPVLEDCSNSNLKISCCRISGLANDKPNRLVVVGHNIWSHFKGLDSLEMGDQIAFTARDGVTYYYSVIENVALYKTEGAEVLAVDGWDITLITCKTDNTWRTVVRFKEIVSEETQEEEPAVEPGEAPVDEDTPAVDPTGVDPGIVTPGMVTPGEELTNSATPGRDVSDTAIPVDNAPVSDPSVYDTPDYDMPVYDTPVYDTPANVIA